jgi:flagellar protein FlaJ
MTDYTIFFLAAIILAPLGYNYYRYLKRKDIIDNFPRFFQEVHNNCSSGMTLVKAVRHSKYANYGSLTPAIRNLCLQIEWGVPFPLALRQFGKKINDSYISGLIDLVDKASVFSPNLGKSMDDIYSHIVLAREIEKERSASLFPQLMSLYIIFFVLLATVFVLFGFFIPSFGVENLAFYKTIFSHLIIIEAVLSGLVAGKIAEGSFKAGIKHSLILLFVGICFIYLYSI